MEHRRQKMNNRRSKIIDISRRQRMVDRRWMRFHNPRLPETSLSQRRVLKVWNQDIVKHGMLCWVLSNPTKGIPTPIDWHITFQGLKRQPDNLRKSAPQNRCEVEEATWKETQLFPFLCIVFLKEFAHHLSLLGRSPKTGSTISDCAVVKWNDWSENHRKVTSLLFG